MRVFLIHPGASVSTSDVYDGYLPALRKRGVEIWRYNLHNRILASAAFLNWQHKRQRKANPSLPKKVNPPDVILHAGQDVLARALWNNMDWIVIVSGMYFHPDWLVLLRKAGLKVAVLLTESPYDDEQQGRFVENANLAWTNEVTSVPYLRQWNEHVYYLPHAYDPARHFVRGRTPDLPSHDVVFVGTGFQERIDMLSQVNWDGIDFGLYGSWDLLGSRHRLRNHIKGSYVENATTNALYSNAKINLNLYRTSEGFGRNATHIKHAESLNPRALELAAAGCFTISDYRPEVESVFGGLVPTVRTATELEEAIRFYLAHPIERERMSAALPAAVEGDTFDARAEHLLRDLHAYDAIGQRSLQLVTTN